MTDTDPSNKARLANGVGLVFLGRMGAIIEGGSFLAFSWIYGPATFGLFVVLWSYVKVTGVITQLAMNPALQRFVPRAGKTDKDLLAGYAIKLSFLVSLTAAIAFSFSAEYLAQFINASETDTLHLMHVIQIYAWVIPFWSVVEVATAAVRATRTFGPEIRVRIFYEQGLRLIGATIFAALGFLTYGLFLAHLVSVLLSAILALRLVSKYYDFSVIIRAPLTGPLARKMWQYGISVMPAYLIKMLFSEFPVMFLNGMLPGASGAAMGGYYVVARKIASTLQAVHKTFEYVIAPLAAEKEGLGDKLAITEILTYSTRLSVSIVLPLGAALIIARNDILTAMRPEFQAAYAAIAVLIIARVVEATTGPSAAIIETLGHRMLPTMNGVAGFIVLVGLGFYLIPEYHVTGAAIAAAAGINTTALLSLFECKRLFNLSPYSSLSARPILVSMAIAGLISTLIPTSKSWPIPTGIISAIAILLVSLALVIRYGLNEADTKPFGKLGKILRHGI